MGVNRLGPAAGRISVVVPVFNEQPAVEELAAEVDAVLAGADYELIFVDDGSTDGSGPTLDRLAVGNPRVKVLHFARNFGKATALAAGFAESTGDVIVTLDGDLQDAPSEIPRLLAALAEGYDLVNGWKVRRQDPFTKVWPSRVFNFAVRTITGVRLHDVNCGLKAYRREVIERLNIYGELYRFIPILAAFEGFRVTEVPVAHRPRRYGRSKYGARRFIAGFLDLLTVGFLIRFSQKPLHIFGPVGLLTLVGGLGINVYLAYLKVALGEPIGTRPLLSLGVLLVLGGLQLLSLGLVGEMVLRAGPRDRRRLPHYRVVQGETVREGQGWPAR
jgi:glycosyltransferase involved in cell wall biosynthesis